MAIDSLPRGSDGGQSRRRFLVIGGGIAGLSAAWHLTRHADAEVRLFEASPQLGGVLRTERIEGCLFEGSADSFLLTPELEPVREILGRIGAEPELIGTNPRHRRALILRAGVLHPVPEGFYLMAPGDAGPILRSRLLDLPGKLRILAERWVPRRRPSGDESLEAFAVRRIGREGFRWLAQPLVAGIYAADPKKLSVQACFPQFIKWERDCGSLTAGARRELSPPRTGETSRSRQGISGARYGRFLSLASGLQRLAECFASGLPPHVVHLRTPVQSLRRLSTGRWETRSTAGIEAFDGVVLAVPARQAVGLIRGPCPRLAEELAGIEYASVAVVCLGYPLDRVASLPPAFGLVIPHAEGRPSLAVSFTSVKFPGREAEDRCTIRVFLGGALRPDLIERDDESLAVVARNELAAILGLRADPVAHRLFRWPLATPQYHVGHLDRIARIESCLTESAGLALAGNSYDGIGIPQCILSGRRAAERIVGTFRGCETP